jgi:predicted unusual protein kinase regulating ubiquinone biosynthesis (AarF/ABC1/UbiB family)
VRFFVTLAGNVVRSPENARQLLEQRHAEIADNALTLLGGLRGGAMKLGQLASFVDVDFVPAEYRAVYQEKLGELCDAAPPMPWSRVRQVLEREWEQPPERLFEDLDTDAAAAASIGQVHRGTLPGGRRVAVKVQYPEVADAVASDLDLASLGVRLARTLAPGLDAAAVAAELRERVLEELDYELEAQHQRAFCRAYRGHPFVYVPDVVTRLSRRRVLVADWVDGMRMREVLELPRSDRDRIGEIVYRFYLGSMHRIGRFNTDPHPGNYLLCADGRIGFLDFGNTKLVDPQWLASGVAVIRAAMERDVERFRSELQALGYFRRAERVDACELLERMLAADDWYLSDGEVTVDPRLVGEIIDRYAEDPAGSLRLARNMQLPTEELWLRRVGVGVLAVLGQLRATANWHRVARELAFGDPPATELGRLEQPFWAGRLAR